MLEVILLVLLVLVVTVVIIFNQLVTLKNNRQQAFSDIDVQLKLRYDLVPNLVNAIKGYATHEKDTLEEVVKMRNLAMSAEKVDDKIKAENQFNTSLKSLFAVAESYPQLKANENYMQLQAQLADIENKIAAARRFFNNATKEYNTVLMSFPANVLNGFFHYEQGNFFDLNNETIARQNVSIIFDQETKETK